MTAEGAVFGARLSADRRSAGLSQAELAERSGLSVRAISNLERGRTRWPHPDTVHRLADALGLPAEACAEFVAAAGRRLGGAAVGPVITAPGDRLSQAGEGRVVPRQLPGPVRQFTGRRNELAALTGLLDPAGAGRSAAVVISALGGMAGVGKTALAVHWAHQVASHFPDGQLFVNLRGYDVGQPMPAGDALAGFLRAMGVAGQDIPDRADERAAAYRSLLAGRRVLVVLDNAHDVAQVRPLLPGSSGCVTVVTSRDALGGLVAGDGAVRLGVGPLPLPEALGLLEGLIGSGVQDDHDAAVRLADQYGRLPLALRVAAELVVARNGVALADLTTELADLQQRLDILETGGDERTTVRTVFTWSYQDLDPAAARMFRLAGIHPGPDISVPAAASLAGMPIARARRALGVLTRAHLLYEHSPGRFSCHDLLRVYATEQATAHDSPARRRAAARRVLDHYLHTSHAAALLLNPHRAPVLALPPPCPGVAPEPLVDHQQALAWFEAEHQVLLGCVSLAAETGSDACARILPWAMTEFLDRRGHWHEWDASQHAALAAATRLGDVAGQAAARRAIATACIRLTDYQQAHAHLVECLQLRRQLGDRTGEALTHHTLGRVSEHQGRYADALRHEQQALDLFRDAADQAGQALALNAIGWYHILLGHPQQARTFCQQALTLFCHTGYRLGQAQACDSLGYAEHQLGHLDHATACYQRALGILRDLGVLFGQADTLARLGDTRAAAADLPAARDAWQQALDILENLRHADAAQVRAKLRQHQHPATMNLPA